MHPSGHSKADVSFERSRSSRMRYARLNDLPSGYTLVLGLGAAMSLVAVGVLFVGAPGVSRPPHLVHSRAVSVSRTVVATRRGQRASQVRSGDPNSGPRTAPARSGGLDEGQVRGVERRPFGRRRKSPGAAARRPRGRGRRGAGGAGDARATADGGGRADGRGRQRRWRLFRREPTRSAISAGEPRASNTCRSRRTEGRGRQRRCG